MIFSATGHRPNKLGGYGAFAHAQLVKVAKKFLEGRRPSTMIVGMAQGWDQAVARACMDLAIPYIAAIPFKGQEREWPSAAQEHYRMLLDRASSARVICEGVYEPWKMQRRNEWMVDHSDQIVALWDGSIGGTANCIKYARSQGKPIINLYEDWEA